MAATSDGPISRLLNRFRPPKIDPDASERIKRWARQALALGDDAAITVSEISCDDPACPGLETVILVMSEGAKTRAFKARGSALVQTRPQIEAALLKA
jgi:hypothetical protein